MQGQRWTDRLGRLGWRPAHYVLLIVVHLHLLASVGKAGSLDWYDFIYPWADALRLTVLKYHQFPLWNPWSMSGQPFFAEPQTAVLTPDTLFLLAFGAVAGFKLLIVAYTLVGYEGTRFLFAQLFGRSRFVEAVSVIPALIPAMAYHFVVGHAVLLAFWMFPWLLGLALTWRRSRLDALGLGIVAGAYLLTYLHYSIIIGFTIAGAIIVYQLARTPPSRETWRQAAIVLCTALGLGLTRIALTVSFLSGFPRLENLHYPIVATPWQVIRTLADPFQNLSTPGDVAGLGWWELGSYVGVTAILLAYEGLRRGRPALRALHVATLLCFVLAWNNRDKFLPGYWLHVIPPWKNMVISTRWRLFGCYLLLVGAVQGLAVIWKRRPKTAAVLAVLVIGDLGLHISSAYDGAFERQPPPFTAAADPPRTTRDDPDRVWQDLRSGLVSMGAEFPLLGWGDHYPARNSIQSPDYRGDFTGHQPLTVESWSPNRVVLVGTPGDTLTLNINPSNYWVMNGERLFPKYRAMEPQEPFHVVVPAGGRIDLRARPPHLGVLLLIQALFAALAAFLVLNYSPTFRRGTHYE